MRGSDDEIRREASGSARYDPTLERILQRTQAATELSAAKQSAEEAARIAQEALSEADTANRAKSVFLATVSHEMRTPLNAIIGFSDIMIEGLLDPAKGVARPLEYARDINTAGHRLLDLINDMLDLAKVSAGKLELQEDLADVGDLFGSCIAAVQERSQEAGITLASEIPDSCPLLRADPGRLRQALLNLLANAIKFTPQGGEVRLTAGIESDGSLAIAVGDNGIGIDPQNFGRILEPFAQVDNGLNRKYSGNGLGLSLSRALVELHGGELAVASELGTGTTVTIRLPAERIMSNGKCKPDARSRKRTEAA